MRKIVTLSFVLLMTVFSLAAQDRKAENILEEVSKKTRAYETVSVDFIFSMDNEEMEIHEENEGSIQLKGQKYMVNLPDIGVKVYSDGVSVWNYMEDGNQVTISSIDAESNELMNPSALFNIYEKDFKSKYIGEKNIEGETFHEIELFPGKEEQDVEKIRLLINKPEMMLSSATLYGKDGNLYGIKMKNMQTNVGLPDDYFDFDPGEYDDIEIIDFR
ncbi:MAG: LolA family protein [Prolixibacteraceae bacterium]